MKYYFVLLLNLICGCLFCAVCLDFDVVHCVSSELIDYKALVELTKNSLQSTDNASFVKKAEQILGRPLTSGDTVQLLESKIESDDQARSLSSRFSDISKSQKLIAVVGLVCFGYVMGPGGVSLYSLYSALNETMYFTTVWAMAGQDIVVSGLREMVRIFGI